MFSIIHIVYISVGNKLLYSITEEYSMENGGSGPIAISSSVCDKLPSWSY